MKIDRILEKKRSLIHQIKLVETSLRHLPYLDGIKREAAEERTRIQSLVSRFGSDMASWSVVHKQDHQRAQGNIDRIANIVKQSDDKKKMIQLELEKLQEQLHAFDQQVAPKDLLILQATYVDISQRVANLEEVVSQEKQKIAEGEQNSNYTLEELTEEKENLLANIACGEISDQERLNTISQEITREEELHESHIDSLIAASQAITGLNRKIELLKKELSVAKQNYIDGMANFLYQELEKAGGEYAREAGKLSGLFMRVVAISSLLEKWGSPRNIFGPYTRQFKIPSFILDACMSHECADMPGIIYKFEGTYIQGAVDSELACLSGLGIEAPS